VAAVESELFPAVSASGEIIITDWLADDLDAEPGDSLYLTYFVMGPFRTLREEQAGFVVKDIIPVDDIPSGRQMMPEFPGMNDAGSCSEWETGAPIDLERIRTKDEDYWNEYGGTPKAFISLVDGKRLWDNLFGSVTAFRISPGSRETGTIETAIMEKMKPERMGMAFIPVFREGEFAAANSTDFGGLFLSLSFFLIAAALLLTALLFSLHIQTRLAEAGILTALGFRRRKIIRIMLMELLVVSTAGSLLGIPGGIFYNKLILFGLNTLWQDAVRTTMLEMHVSTFTLLTGATMGIILVTLILILTLIRKLRKPIVSLVKEASLPSFTGLKIKRRRFVILTAILSAVALALLVYLLAVKPAGEAGLYLATGGLILAAGISFIYLFLIRMAEHSGSFVPGFPGLAIKNAGLKRNRTITAVMLLALGAFTVIITGANRKTFYGSEMVRQSGTGGFLLWMETTMPLLYDLNTVEGKTYYAMEEEPLLEDIRFLQMHRLDGDDASCLNLNQVPRPMILGIPENEFHRLQAFHFVNLHEAVNPASPWLALDKELSPGVLPAFMDQTVITWGVQKAIGDTLAYLDEAGQTLNLVLMGGLDNSVFQGHILVSDRLLKHHYPSLSGSRVMLVDGPYEKRDETTDLLETLFTDFGPEAVTASGKLAEFNTVENTYLSVFMLLGALGVLLGTIGLGIVILRNILERKTEYALLQALGFSKKSILAMMVMENMFILAAGISTGAIAAIAGILPSLLSPAYQLPGLFLLAILGLIILNGCIWIYIPARMALRGNLMDAIRME